MHQQKNQGPETRVQNRYHRFFYSNLRYLGREPIFFQMRQILMDFGSSLVFVE